MLPEPTLVSTLSAKGCPTGGLRSTVLCEFCPGYPPMPHSEGALQKHNTSQKLLPRCQYTQNSYSEKIQMKKADCCQAEGSASLCKNLHLVKRWGWQSYIQQVQTTVIIHTHPSEWAPRQSWGKKAKSQFCTKQWWKQVAAGRCREFCTDRTWTVEEILGEQYCGAVSCWLPFFKGC